MKKIKKNNIVSFPNTLSESEREIEAIIFSASEPLDIETVESKISKKTGKAGIFSGSLELVREGELEIKQEKLFDDIFVKETRWKN